VVRQTVTDLSTTIVALQGPPPTRRATAQSRPGVI